MTCFRYKKISPAPVGTQVNEDDSQLSKITNCHVHLNKPNLTFLAQDFTILQNQHNSTEINIVQLK
jgi:hypothetical protein